MKTFDGVNIENLLYCPNLEYCSGIKTQLLYAPSSFFRNIILPTSGEYSEFLTVKSDDIEFRGMAEWCCIDILIDNSELKMLIAGQTQRKRSISELEFYILGFQEKNLGFIEKHKNTPFVFGVVDSNGTPWLLGNLRNRAFFDSAEASTGKKYEDNSGISVKISANSPIYRYEKKFDEIARSGSFTKGFSLGFNS